VIFGTLMSPAGDRRIDSAAPFAEVGFFWSPSGAAAAGPAIVEFQRPTISPDCVERVVLEFSVEAAFAEQTVAVYPADPRVMATPVGAYLPDEYLIDNRPRGVVTFQGLRASSDITELYRTYLGTGYFPSKGRRLPSNPPPNLVLAVQPQAATQPRTFRLVTPGTGDINSSLLRLSSRC